ncbi:MAG: hypothetical protein Q9226_000451 [Calogaya cf. arnoldii]
MSFGDFLQRTGATPLQDDEELGVYHGSFNTFRSSSYRDSDPNLQVAADIVAYISYRYLRQLSVTPAVDTTRLQEEPSVSARSRGSKALQPYLTDLSFTEEEFLAELSDSEGDPRNASGFHDRSEVIWHDFPLPAVPAAPKEEPSGPTFLWVRAEYVRILEYLKKSGHKGVVITGQPGIGKTRLIYYLLISRLRENKPVLMHVPVRGGLILFHKTGNYVIPLNDSEDGPKNNKAFRLPRFASHLKDLWVLLDAVDYKEGIPRWSRWKTLQQAEYFPRVLIMNPYTRMEALLLAILEAEARPLEVPSDFPRSLHRKRELCALAMKFFDQNPGPRCFIHLAWTDPNPATILDGLRDVSKKAVSKAFTKEDLMQLMSPETNPTSEEYSHTIVCVYRDPADDDYHLTDSGYVRGIVRIPNAKLNTDLQVRLDALDLAERRRFFKLVSDNPKTSSIAGTIFRSQLMQLWKRDGIRLDVHNLQEVNANPESITFQFTSPSTKLDIHVSEVDLGYSLPKRLENSVLYGYYPENPKLPAIDFLIRDTKDQYYGIQVILATTHKIAPQLHHILAGRGVKDSQYTHVFVQGRGGGSYRDGDKNMFTVPNSWQEGFGFKIRVAWIDYPLDPLI